MIKLRLTLPVVSTVNLEQGNRQHGGIGSNKEFKFVKMGQDLFACSHIEQPDQTADIEYD